MLSIDAALAELGLAPTRLTPVGNHDLLRHQVYALETENKPVILKLFFLDRLAREVKAYALAQASGIPVPRVLRAGKLSGGAGYLLMTRLPGSTYAGMPKQAEIYREMGENLAKLHANACPPDPGYGAWLVDRASRHMARIRAQSLPAGDLFSIEAAYAKLCREVHFLRLDTAPFGFSHGDYDERNVLAQDGRLTGILDFECSRYGTLEHDLAQIYRKTFIHPENAGFRAAFEAGYQSRLPLLPGFYERLPYYWIDGCLDCFSWAYPVARDYYDESMRLLRRHILRDC